MSRIFYEADSDPALIRGRSVGIVGYGSQGHAHALNLRDSGISVRVGLRSDSRSRTQAEANGLQVCSVVELAGWADIIMILAPDPVQPEIFREQIQDGLTAGKTLMFAHGFNIRYGTIQPPPDIDVSMIAPKSPGHRVRETFLSNEGTPALLAVHQDASGQARQVALAYAHAIGCARAGVIQTTFREETETDLFGEQAVLCGGVSALVKAGFDTLVEAGYQPEVAYFECLHELKLIVDLMYRGGLRFMRHSVSDTAEYGDYTAGPEVIDERVRATMKRILERVQNGSFADQWITENQSGRDWFEARRAEEREHLIEDVGRRLRANMSFLEDEETETDRLPAAIPG